MSSFIDGQEDVGGAAHVFQGEIEEEFAVVVHTDRDQASQLRVVAIGAGDRLGEDRGVRRRAGDVTVVNEASELAGVQQLSRERVEPDRYAHVLQRAAGP